MSLQKSEIKLEANGKQRNAYLSLYCEWRTGCVGITFLVRTQTVFQTGLQ